MADELSAPLGRKKRSRRNDASGFRLGGLPLGRVLFAVIALVLMAIGGALLFANQPEGGRPVSEIAVSSGVTRNGGSGETPTETSEAEQATTGVSVSEMVSVPATEGEQLQPAEMDFGEAPDASALNAFGVLPELVEESQNGPIPRISASGETPFSAYSRPSISLGSANHKPLVAVIITGMGLSEAGTLEAAEKLPGGVTLAFAPYGRTLARTSAAARDAGHEIMLQIPLEPFDYPDNDPGPQTLLTGQTPRANLDRLLWLLARLGGYSGVVNHMGARFTASAADFGPVMEELGSRGLAYVDDGTSNRSLAANLARNNHVPFAKAEVQLDETPSRAAILDALDKLEVLARANGSAIGVASALPVSIETIAEWAHGLEDKNLILVPASAVMEKP